MAIVKFQQEASTDFTLFNTFLQQNKEGTFLEDATITFSSETPNVLTISDGSSSVEIKLYTTVPSGSNYVVKLTGSSITGGMLAHTYSTGYVKMTGAILCSTGLIFEGTAIVASAVSASFYFVLTVDSSGKLAVIYPLDGGSSNADHYSCNKTRVLVYDSTQILTFGSNPQFDANLTALAPIASITLENDSYIPFVQSATATQLPSAGLQAVSIEGTDYITNGVWYIKDGA